MRTKIRNKHKEAIETAVTDLQSVLDDAEDEGVLRDGVDDVISRLTETIKPTKTVTIRSGVAVTVNTDFVAPKTTPRSPKGGLLKERDRGCLRKDNG